VPEILALLQNIAPLLDPTTVRQLSQVLFGMLVISGRLTMLGLSRWTEKGGSYRTIQRLYHSGLPWKALHWSFFRWRFLKPKDEYIVAGDEVVVSKAGRKTYGLDRFFSGVQHQVIPSLSFFAFALVNVRDEQSYPMQTTQTVKSAEEKAASQAKAVAKKVKPTGDKNKPGRPKGSRNKDKQEVVLNPELVRIQTALLTLLETVGTSLPLNYVVMDGHFGNYPSAFMVRQVKLHLISKLRFDAALYPAFDGEYRGRGPNMAPNSMSGTWMPNT
jgi:putative transposase